MRGFLIDTNVISEIVKPCPHPRVVRWIESQNESRLHLSVLTTGEMRKGITLLAGGQRRTALETWLDHDLALRFSGRILPVDIAVANRWGKMSGSDAARKSPLPVIDGLLAATALQYDLTLVSRDTGRANITGADVFDPWAS